MFRKQLPQDWQKAFIAQKHFPRRLNKLHASATETRPKLLVPEPLPRIQFERVSDSRSGHIDEALIELIPPDVLYINRPRGYAGLFARVAQVQHGLLVFRVVLHAAEMNG